MGTKTKAAKATRTIPLIGSTKIDQMRVTVLLESMGVHTCEDASCWLCQGLHTLSNNSRFTGMAKNINSSVASAFVTEGPNGYMFAYIQALAFCFMLGTRYQQNLELEAMLSMEDIQVPSPPMPPKLPKVPAPKPAPGKPKASKRI